MRMDTLHSGMVAHAGRFCPPDIDSRVILGMSAASGGGMNLTAV
jgi:hypothetical protein